MSQAAAPVVTTGPRPREQRFGLGCALITPFAADGSVDVERLVNHARRVVAEGCTSVTLFGTTGEGASLGLASRAAALEGMAAAGFDFPRQVLGGVAASSVEEALAQADQLADAGCRGMLLAPPFYFKGPGDEGLYRWFSTVLERARRPGEVILYHIPSVTSVPLSSALIGRLAQAFPGAIAGIKDSSGDWATTQRYLADHPQLHVLVGDERQLARAIRHGGSGAINGFSNFCAPLLRPMVDEGTDVPDVSALVDLVLEFPVTPAVKALVARLTGDDGYLRTAPPLVPAEPAARARLAVAFDALQARRAG